MAHSFGMMKLGSPEQWKDLAGEDTWVPTRSAYELAYAWHGANGIPGGIAVVSALPGIEWVNGSRPRGVVLVASARMTD